MLFSSSILEIAIGLVLVYFIGSVIVSHLNEGVAGIFNLRANSLFKGIIDLLNDEDSAEELYKNPLIQNLYSQKLGGGKRPTSYITSRTFVLTLFTKINEGAEKVPSSLEELRKQVKNSAFLYNRHARPC